jgi:hypothetical protein
MPTISDYMLIFLQEGADFPGENLYAYGTQIRVHVLTSGARP